VTDADLVLGRLDPDNFAGGSIKLDAFKSEEALAELGAPLGMHAQAAAFGLSEVVDGDRQTGRRPRMPRSGHSRTRIFLAVRGACRISDKFRRERRSTAIPPVVRTG
jgi:N-methylhydantoinase A/oxoprolinase/acetone carboxylase beta subunit